MRTFEQLASCLCVFASSLLPRQCARKSMANFRTSFSLICRCCTVIARLYRNVWNRRNLHCDSTIDSSFKNESKTWNAYFSYGASISRKRWLWVCLVRGAIHKWRPCLYVTIRTCVHIIVCRWKIILCIWRYNSRKKATGFHLNNKI